MSWDIDVPDGSRNASLGDNDIREFKADIQNALRAQVAEGNEAVFPGTDADNPVYRPRFARGVTGSRPTASADEGLYIDTTRNAIQRCNDSSWDDIATLIPAGTVMVFFQASAPTGWTQNVDHNDAVLNVVNGAGGGSGGSNDFSSAAHSHTVNSHTHSTPNHVHNLSYDNIYLSTKTTTKIVFDAADEHLFANDGNEGGGASTLYNVTINTASGQGSGTSGGATPGTSSTALSLKYITVIIASKD